MPTNPLIRASAAIYGLSFLLPVAPERFLGVFAFLTSLLHPFFWPAWAANPIYRSAWRAYGRGEYRSAAYRAWAAFALSTGGVLWIGYFAWGPGYWAWATSMALLAVTCTQMARAEPTEGVAYPVRPVAMDREAKAPLFFGRAGVAEVPGQR